jgi:hypothetical protein
VGSEAGAKDLPPERDLHCLKLGTATVQPADST